MPREATARSSLQQAIRVPSPAEYHFPLPPPAENPPRSATTPSARHSTPSADLSSLETPGLSPRPFSTRNAVLSARECFSAPSATTGERWVVKVTGTAGSDELSNSE